MKFGRKFVAILMTLCVLGGIPALAVEPNTPSPVAQTESNEIVPYADELEWIVIIKDGRILKRLFNHTSGKWETDWIDCGPAPSV